MRSTASDINQDEREDYIKSGEEPLNEEKKNEKKQTEL